MPADMHTNKISVAISSFRFLVTAGLGPIVREKWNVQG